MDLSRGCGDYLRRLTVRLSQGVAGSVGRYNPAGERAPPRDRGLRAIAVIAVVLYLGVPGFTGGFVGVDVFFVISGYVITWQLWSHRSEPPLQLLAGFYARRARRIVPALALVIIVTLALGKLFLLPYGEQQGLARSAIAAAFFVANLNFHYGADHYFAQPAELQPLLHTWSLAVEEQFYLLWPVLLVLAWAVPRRRDAPRPFTVELAAVTLLTAISFLVSSKWSQDFPRAAFFLLPARFWELGVGAALALWMRAHGPPGWPASVATVGLLGIVAAAFVITPAAPFPGYWALLPVASCALVIAAGERDSLARRVLAARPMVFTGRVSYAWYLWHWPLLALVRCVNAGEHAIVAETAAVLAAYGLACLSTIHFEDPIRRQRWRIAAGTAPALASAAVLLLVTAALSAVLLLEARERNRTELLSASDRCVHVPSVFIVRDVSSCALSEGTAGVVFLVGDSHAAHWSPAVAAWARSNGLRAVERTYAACVPPIRGYYGAGCEEFSRSVLGEITAAATAGHRVLVILGARWSNHPLLLEGARAASPFAQALATVTDLGVPVLILAMTPEFERAIPECVARRGERACARTRAAHDARVTPVLAQLRKAAAAGPAVRLLDPTAAFCDAAWCHPVRDGVLLFRDAHHLSRKGAEGALPFIRDELDRLLAASRARSAVPGG